MLLFIVIKPDSEDSKRFIFNVVAHQEKVNSMSIYSLDIFIKLCHIKWKRVIFDVNIEEWAGYERLSVIKNVHKESNIELRMDSRKISCK